MLDGHHFVMSGKDNLMHADNGAAAHGMNTDFVSFTFSAHAVTVILITRVIGDFFTDRVGDHQRGAAGSIELAVMVLLHDFHIKAVAQYLRRFSGERNQQIDAERHITGMEKGDLLGGFLYLRQLSFGIAGGAEHGGHLFFHRHGQDGIERAGVGKVDNDVGVLGHVRDIGVYLIALRRGGVHIHTRDDLAVVPLADNVGNGGAHFAVAAAQNDFCHGFILPFRFCVTSKRLVCPQAAQYRPFHGIHIVSCRHMWLTAS